MFNIPQKFDGISVLPAAEFNSMVDELKNIITSSGQALTGADVTQIAKGMANYIMNGNFFTDSGVANAYLLGVVGAKLSPTLYTNGFTALFKVGNTNTGAASVNVAGLGVKSIKKNNGASDLDPGDLPIGNVVELVYDLSGDYFELTRTEFISGDFLRRNVTSNVTVGYTTTAYSMGNSGTGTVTPLIANGHIQTIAINGNFTLAAPTDTQSGFIEIEATVSAPGGFTINTGAYTLIENNFVATSGQVNLFRILKIGSVSYLSMRPAAVTGSSAGGYLPYNAIINSGMGVAQRGTSFAAVANNQYTMDRWMAFVSSTGVGTIAQTSDVPDPVTAENYFPNSLRYTVTSTAGVSAGTSLGILQYIEGSVAQPMLRKALSLSFWVKSSVTGTYCVSLLSGGEDRSVVFEYTVNVANTWEKKTFSVPATLSSGTYSLTTGRGLVLRFVLASGSTFNTATTGSWVTGSGLQATANQTNLAAVNSSTFYVTGVQLEPNATVSPYFAESFDQTLDKCLRYYEKSYNYALAPGYASGTAAQVLSASDGALYIGNAIAATSPQPTSGSAPAGKLTKRKRAIGTTQVFNPSNGSSGNARDVTTNTNQLANLAVGEAVFVVGFPTFGTLEHAYEVQYTVDAEL